VKDSEELKSWQQSVKEGMESTIDYLERRIKMDETSKQVMEDEIRINKILDNIVKEVAELRKLTSFIQE
jgi:hypothetical protein